MISQVSGAFFAGLEFILVIMKTLLIFLRNFLHHVSFLQKKFLRCLSLKISSGLFTSEKSLRWENFLFRPKSLLGKQKMLK